MTLTQQMHYKQRNPDETVQDLQDILAEHDIEVDEIWQKESSIGTRALRLNVKGASFGTNGKGVSFEYARASAYAEFFERYQNDAMGPKVNFGKHFPFNIAPDEKYLSAQEIVADDNSFIRYYFERLGLGDSSASEKAKAFYDAQKADYISYGIDNNYLTLPFFSVANGSIAYLPKSTYSAIYGSNGMCAGNTPEEALVQGLSEVIERVVQKRIFQERPTFPDVPDEYIKRFPYVYEMVQKMRAQEKEGYRFWIKDCSFGGQYPVAALIVAEVNSGKYGVKLGCHPDFGIAIERTLTEATQGQDITEYASRSIIDFTNHNVDSWTNMCNSFKWGQGQYPYQLFGRETTYPFTPAPDVSGLSNTDLLKEWVQNIIGKGFDILVRDVSYFGFPSFHIIIPGLSEMMPLDGKRFRANNTRYYISEILRHEPEKISRENCKLFIATMNYYLTDAFENTMESYYGIVDKNDIPCENIRCGCLYMIAMCFAMIGDYGGAAKQMRIVTQQAENGLRDGVIDQDEYVFLLATKYYFDAIMAVENHDTAIEYLRCIFSPSICESLDGLYSDTSRLIVAQYPSKENGGLADADRYPALFGAATKCTYALRKQQSNNQIEQCGLAGLFEGLAS